MIIEGSVAIVTGGASGLGEATSTALAARGAHVVIADLNEERGNALAASLHGTFVKTDVADTASVRAMVEAAAAAGSLRILVNCAGVGWPGRTIGKDGQFESAFNLDVFRKVIEINLIGSFDVLRHAATVMSTQEPNHDGERGVIVNTASVAAFDGQIGQAAYSASKGGVVGMTLPIARDLSVSGIRVNTIAPGLIDTPIYGSGEASEQFKERLSKDLLFPRRLGGADEFARLAIELVENGYMNAETIRIDGGIRMGPK